jgi:hypothetical protein
MIFGKAEKETVKEKREERDEDLRAGEIPGAWRCRIQ